MGSPSFSPDTEDRPGHRASGAVFCAAGGPSGSRRRWPPGTGSEPERHPRKQVWARPWPADRSSRSAAPTQGRPYWPLLSNLGRPRDGPALPHWTDGRHLAAPRLNLSRRQSATTAGALTDHARVCLVPPPQASATLSVPSTRASRDGQPVTTTPEPSAREAACIRGGFKR